MFVYKEDFDKVVEALQETVDYIKTELMPNVDFSQFNTTEEYEENNRTPALTDETEDDVFGGSDLKWE